MEDFIEVGIKNYDAEVNLAWLKRLFGKVEVLNLERLPGGRLNSIIRIEKKELSKLKREFENPDREVYLL